LQSTRWKWVILSVVAIAAICAGVIGFLKPSTGVSLTDLNNFEELKTQFNRDKGKPRLLLLLSPT
jgi:hypothetical protein